ncbi:MAG TPA: HAD-IIIC family phosphatase [Rhizomicrobium sp.]|jgi:FkbH-like protein
MPENILALPWLSPAPADFSAQCRAVPEGGDFGAGIQRLASMRLNASQSAKLARTMRKLGAAGHDLSPLSGFRLGVLANATFDLVIDCIPAAAARHGVAVEIIPSPYDQVMQQALDPESDINRAKPDAVLIAVDHRWLKADRADLTTDPEARALSALSSLRTVVDNLGALGGCPAILQTVPAPPQSLFGSFDRRISGSVRGMVDRLNRGIVEIAEQTGSYLLDVAALAERVGTDVWFDPVHWVTYKLPFSAECFPIYGELLGRLLGAIRGKARKCLVLDCDNTLWGGVIGDDGLEGLTLGQGSALGESFLSLQQYALELRNRGIMLAICSKNDHEVARRPFREHPEMVLKESHIAVFQANWLDKPSNLEAIAKTLNIGLDALVMLDDNPAERAQIRAALPMVAVPELPSDPSWFTWYLTAAGYFEAVSYSSEDAARADSYAADTRRAEVLERTRDLGDYLASLEMTIQFAPFDAPGRKRIAQLINKTNQFNLTTRRYTEADVKSMENSDSMCTLQVRLGDRFGDLGMIGAVICRPADTADTWDIDTWLMSCRVLGRRVEEAMLARVVDEARKRGVRRLIGTYIPTAKNGMVRDHYAKLGFDLIEETDGIRRFALSVADVPAARLPFVVVDRSFENAAAA